VSEPRRSAAFCALVFLVRYLWLTPRVRVRRAGSLPRDRGATLVVVNHQHEDEVEILVGYTMIAGPFFAPIYTSASRRLFERGYLAAHLPLLRRVARNFDATRLFVALGILPIENELATRPLRSVALAVRDAVGDLPLATVFERPPCVARSLVTLDDVLGASAHETAIPTRLVTLREPYRSATIARTRALLEDDLARIERHLRAGATFVTTGEGRYSTTGRVRPLRGIVSRLAPLAAPHLAAVAFDPFRGRRLSLFFRIASPTKPEALELSLAAARPITTSAVLAGWLRDRSTPFAPQEATWAVARAVARLPPEAFVDPELRADPVRAADEALRGMRRRGWLVARGGTLALAHERRDPRFPLVEDIVAFAAEQYAESLAAHATLGATA